MPYEKPYEYEDGLDSKWVNFLSNQENKYHIRSFDDPQELLTKVPGFSFIQEKEEN